MQRHVSDIHGFGVGHHLQDVHRLHEDYRSHSGRWLVDHPLLPLLLTVGILTILILILISVVYFGV